MAAPSVRCCLSRVLAQSPKHHFSRTDCHSSVLPCFSNLLISSRYYATSDWAQKKHLEAERKRKLRWKLPIPSKPTDDVYLTWCYEKTVYEAEELLDMLKKFQQLEFVSPNQPVYTNLTLDMALDKKTVVPFTGTIVFPHRFTDSVNAVLAFTQNAQEADLAREYGAAFAGGTELISPILNREIKPDYFVTVVSMLQNLKPLKTFLNEKFPSNKSGSVGYDIPKMINFFKLCHEYVVVKDNLIETQIATLDMPNDQIVANLDALIKDVCKYKPLRYGPFVTSLSLQSLASEGLLIKVAPFLPEVAVKVKVKKEEEEQAKEEDHDSDQEEMERSS